MGFVSNIGVQDNGSSDERSYLLASHLSAACLPPGGPLHAPASGLAWLLGHSRQPGSPES